MYEFNEEGTDLFRVDRKWSLTLTICAVANLNLLGCILVKRTQHGAAFLAVKLDILELGKYPAPSGDDTRNANKIVQIGTTEVTERGAEWEIRNSNVNFRVYALICWVINEDGVQCHLVEYDQHRRGRVREKIGEDGFRNCEMQIRHLERFRVGLTWIRQYKADQESKVTHFRQDSGCVDHRQMHRVRRCRSSKTGGNA